MLEKHHRSLLDKHAWYKKWHDHQHRSLYHLSLFLAISAFSFVMVATAFQKTTTFLTEAATSDQVATAQSDIQAVTYDSLKKATTDLLSANKEYELAANQKAKDEALVKVKAKANLRKQALLKALDSNVSNAERVALPEEFRSRLPQEAQLLVEKEVSLEGNVETLVKDYFKANKSVQESYLRTSNGERYELNSAAKIYPSKNKVKVSGFLLGKELLVPSATTNSSLNTIAPQNATLSNTNLTTAVLLVNFRNNKTQPYTIDQVRNKIFTGPNSVNAFWQENSFGNIKLTGLQRPDGDVFGYFTIDADDTNCYADADPGWVGLTDQMARNSGVSISSYQRIIYFFASPDLCQGIAGWAYFPAATPVRAELFGPTYFVTPIIAHEVGHTLGLQHAGTLACDNPPFEGNCSRDDYGDPFDIMGNRFTYVDSSARHTNAYNKAGISSSIIPPENVKTVSSPGTYTLVPMETKSSNTQLLRVKLNDSESLLLEYRKPIGIDDSSTGYPKPDGVFVRKVSSTEKYSFAMSKTGLINLGNNYAMPLGTSYQIPSQNIRFALMSANTTTATIEVSSITSQCIRSAPTVVPYTISEWWDAGQRASYSFEVTNKDNNVCGPATFRLNVSGDPTFTLSVVGDSFTLNPGEKRSVSFFITSPTNAKEGLYQFTGTATNLSTNQAGSATVNYNVNPSKVCSRSKPVVSITPLTQEGQPGSELSYSLSIQNTDTVPCGSSNFYVRSTFTDSGMTQTPTSIVETIAPGASITKVLKIKSTGSITPGSYPFLESVVNAASGFDMSVSATYSVKNIETCARANPTVSVTQSQTSAQPGQAITYSVNVKNNDNSLCASSVFGISTSLPSGFSQSPSWTSESLAPGASITRSVGISSPGSAAAGSYQIAFTAANSSNSGYTGSGQGTYTVTTTGTPTPNPNPDTDSTGPTITFISPSNPEITTSVYVSISATDVSGVTYTMIRIKEEPNRGTYCSGKSTCNFSWAPTDPGTYTIVAEAGDGKGNKSTKEFSITKPGSTANTCTRYNPSVSVSPSQGSATAGQAVRYAVTIQNNDNSNCAVSTFGITTSLPSGFSQNVNWAAESLLPGGSITRNIDISSPSTATNGTYEVSFTALNQSQTAYSGTGKASFTVSTVNTPPPTSGDGEGPTITFTQPENNSKILNSATINISASDPSGVAYTIVRVSPTQGTYCSNKSTCYYSWYTADLSPGNYTVTAEAADLKGNKSTKTLNLIK